MAGGGLGGSGVPLAGRYADPLGFSQNPYADPHALAAFLTRFTAIPSRILTGEGGSPMYYTSGFLPAGGAQTAGGGGLLSAITSGLETFLPAIFNRPAQVQTAPVAARTPPMLPGGSGGPLTKVMTGISTVANQHPVLTAAGGAAATAGAAALGARSLRGHKVTVHPSGMVQVHRKHRRMNPCNIHALRRGIRRLDGFARVAKKVLHFTHPHQHLGKPVFKHRKRKRGV